MQSALARVFIPAPAVDVRSLTTSNSATMVQRALLFPACAGVAVKERASSAEQGQPGAGIERGRRLNSSELMQEPQKMPFPFFLKPYRPHTAPL